MTPLIVAAGAALGAALRFWVAHHLDDRTPWGTLAVNVAGSFVLGLLVGSDPSTDALWTGTSPRRRSARPTAGQRAPTRRTRGTEMADPVQGYHIAADEGDAYDFLSTLSQIHEASFQSPQRASSSATIGVILR